MIVQCTWHKPIPIFLRDKPPFEDNRLSDGICEECVRQLFEPAGIKAGAEKNDTLIEFPSNGCFIEVYCRAFGRLGEWRSRQQKSKKSYITLPVGKRFKKKRLMRFLGKWHLRFFYDLGVFYYLLHHSPVNH